MLKCCICGEARQIFALIANAIDKPKPCEWCEGKKYMQGSVIFEGGDYSLFIEDGDFNFCPNCGRKLEE